MANKPITIERTGKRWKRLQAVGCLGLLTGAIVLYLGTSVVRAASSAAITRIELSNLSIAGLALLVAGFCVLTYGRLGAWWYHG
jgi:hypothetical protein